MASNTNNVKLGVCTVSFDGVDLGLTKGGVEVEVTTETKKVEVDQYGKTTINEIIMSRNVMAKVPLAETTLSMLARIMPGAVLTQSGGTKATGLITFVTAVPVNNDKVTINGVDFTFKTVPVGPHELAIPATIAAAGPALAAAIKNSVDPRVSSLIATAVGAVVTLTAVEFGSAYNSYTLAKTFATTANLTLSGATLTGGVDYTKAKVVVPTAIGANLLASAKKLVLHPIELPVTNRSEDFVIPLANTPGALSYAYKLEDERIFNVQFSGYPDPQTGALYIVGDESAPNA